MSKKQKSFFWSVLLAVLVCVGALALVVTRARTLSPTETGILTEINPIPQASVTPRPRGPVQNIRFTVYDVGIYPRQLRIKQGVVGISIEDRTGSSAGLLIGRENGNVRLPIGQVMRLVNQVRGRNRFSLEPGHYRVLDSSRRTSEAELIVEP